jgi:hypothetical protein
MPNLQQSSEKRHSSEGLPPGMVGNSFEDSGSLARKPGTNQFKHESPYVGFKTFF